ncbi:MAG: 5'-nucleotidase C-terminal domain-containing protein, partial [Gammaproteobacteria bacterium]|nr:5'-nucleotidase C-terminal domain-containing protein [Gammaproteobacteria bacterium]
MSNFKRLSKRSDGNKLSAHIKTGLSVGLFGLLVGATAPVLADSEVMIIQVSDLHGNMVPHAGIIETTDGEYAVTQGGGLAKVATVINELRGNNENNLVLGVGDSIHGSAEVMFTMGDAMMPAWNAMGLDAYTPGNWEFGYGPAVFRARFTNVCKAHPELQNPALWGASSFPAKALCPPIAGNMVAMTSADGVPGVTVANFPTLAANLYNGGPYPRVAGFFGKRPLDAYKIFTRDGVNIAVIGLTAAIVPQQAPVFSRTFSFTQGTEELQEVIDTAKSEGAEIIIVQSELGLPQNVQIGREFKDVDVILSAHSHEVTLGAILADEEGSDMVFPEQGLSNLQQKRLNRGASIIVEAGEDLYVGALKLKISGGNVTGFEWEAVPVDDKVLEDDTIADLVESQEKYFIAGPDFKKHTFLPAAYCSPSSPCMPNANGEVEKGLRLVDSLDTVVGTTDTLLHRHHSIEGVMNNFFADAVRSIMVDESLVSSAPNRNWADADVLSMTNGFRFDTVVLPADMVPAGATFQDGRDPGEVTLRDIYSYFPIAPGLVAADFSGSAIEGSLAGVLKNVFDPNPFIQRGGWYLGLSENMTQKIDVINLPKSTSGSRIVETRIDGALINPSKRYVLASCYGHTFPDGRVCRTDGGANAAYFELANPEDYTSAITLVEPIPTPGGLPLINNKAPIFPYAENPIFRST